MKCIRCAGTAIEACATRCGTFVGPLLTELIGFPELTPYAGGWCGNELFNNSFSPELRAQAHALTERLGDELWQRGYRGYFEVDYLTDLDTDEVYLGELNPRITGISAMTNTSNFCHDTIPLFLFHLLEYSDCQLELDPTDFNRQSLHQGAQGTASQIILKYTKKELNVLSDAPPSGVYQLEGTTLSLVKPGHSRREALAPNQAYLLRIMKKEEYVYKGADLAILFLNIQVKEAERELSPDAATWLTALTALFPTRELSKEEKKIIERFHQPLPLLKGHGSQKEKVS